MKIIRQLSFLLLIAADPKFHGRAKHIDSQYNFSRDAQARKIIKVTKCSTVSMVADSMTKFMGSNIMQTLHTYGSSSLLSFAKCQYVEKANVLYRHWMQSLVDY